MNMRSQLLSQVDRGGCNTIDMAPMQQKREVGILVLAGENFPCHLDVTVGRILLWGNPGGIRYR